MGKKRPRWKSSQGRESKGLERWSKGSKLVEAEVAELVRRIGNECPTEGQVWEPRRPQQQENVDRQEDGTAESNGSCQQRKGKNEGFSAPTLTAARFVDLPISSGTVKALEKNGFMRMTPVQQNAIPHALAGRDVLGEAETGSGKTLAFVIPVVEKLYRERWSAFDGLGGLILSPTRELATQTFDVLCKVAGCHEIQCGCVIGGNRVRGEEPYLREISLLVATPGRLIHYLDESPNFDSSNLIILAIDEADRLVDLGFAPALEIIVSQLPPPKTRQNLFFSATLNASTEMLLKIVPLQKPEICCTLKGSSGRVATPQLLRQVFSVVPYERKIDALFAFLTMHSNQKIIVFVSACKQVRFLSLIFEKMKPGSAVLALHGRMSHFGRLTAMKRFTEKSRGVLICTDIASRGIDFPRVDWVVQSDCPDSVETYIHRVGRTARYNAKGNALLFLTPSEEAAFLVRLKAAEIVVSREQFNNKQTISLKPRLQTMLASDPELKFVAQRAFASYFRSVFLMPDKDVFDPKKIPVAELASSMGLALVPSVKFLDSGQDAKDDTGGCDTGGCEGFHHKNAPKNAKNMSKLERFKAKIREKKISKGLAAAAAETAPQPALLQGDTVRGSSGVDKDSNDVFFEKKTSIEVRKDENVDIETAASAMAASSPSSFERAALVTPQSRHALRREKIRIKADGTATVRGLGNLTSRLRSSGHVMFEESSSDEDDDQTAATVKTKPRGSAARFSKLVAAMSRVEAAEDADISSDDDADTAASTPGVTSGGATATISSDADGQRSSYLRKLKRRLAVKAQEDKNRERERVHKKHNKRRAKIRAERVAVGEGDRVVELVAGDSDREESDYPEEIEEKKKFNSSLEDRQDPPKRLKATPIMTEECDQTKLEQLALARLLGSW